MKLTRALNTVIGINDTRTIEGITYDSRAVGARFLFVAVKGFASDGHHYIEQAIVKGATAILHNNDADVAAAKAKYPGVIFIGAADTRRSLPAAAKAFYGDPSADVNVVAVTGTNGKTTTSLLVKNIFEAAGKKGSLIGTICNYIGDERVPSEHTTPESSDLMAFIDRMKHAGSFDLAMEASSHALYLGRCDGVHFDAVLFTNLTEDHLDFHKSMDAYLDAKLIAFDLLGASKKARKVAVVNRHTDGFDRITERVAKHRLPLVSYGLAPDADYYAADVVMSYTGMRYTLMHEKKALAEVVLSLTGEFNVLNSLAALSYAHAAGFKLDMILPRMKTVQVPGRFEIVNDSRVPFAVIVDYAHTDDALINVLSTIRKMKPRKVISVFGCGGDRDRKKRPLMGKAVGELSDYAVVTMDNPRTEDMQQIIDDIKPGIDATGIAYDIIMDRREAIHHAIAKAEANDIVLIAGKGHEDYQIFRDKTIHFDDREVAREELSKR